MSVIILKFNSPDYFVLKFTKLIKNYRWVRPHTVKQKNKIKKSIKVLEKKNRNHFHFEGPSQTVPDVGDFYDECEHE